MRPWVKPPVRATGSQAARHGDGAFRLAAEFDAEVGAALHQLAVLAVTNVHRLHARQHSDGPGADPGPILSVFPVVGGVA